jgi:hypothetical protein
LRHEHEFARKWWSTPPGQSPGPEADAPPDLYAAMEQLRVQKTKTSVPVMVIDKVENRPRD